MRFSSPRPVIQNLSTRPAHPVRLNTATASIAYRLAYQNVRSKGDTFLINTAAAIESRWKLTES